MLRYIVALAFFVVFCQAQNSSSMTEMGMAATDSITPAMASVTAAAPMNTTGVAGASTTAEPSTTAGSGAMSVAPTLFLLAVSAFFAAAQRV